MRRIVFLLFDLLKKCPQVCELLDFVRLLQRLLATVVLLFGNSTVYRTTRPEVLDTAKNKVSVSVSVNFSSIKPVRQGV